MKPLDTRLKDNLRRRLSKALKGAPRHKKAHQLLGCGLKHFKKHLEKGFDETMNWDNYGSFWAIDHIKPLMTFNMTKFSEQKKSFHCTNLRALSHDKNRKRKKKVFEKD